MSPPDSEGRPLTTGGPGTEDTIAVSIAPATLRNSDLADQLEDEARALMRRRAVLITAAAALRSSRSIASARRHLAAYAGERGEVAAQALVVLDERTGTGHRS